MTIYYNCPNCNSDDLEQIEECKVLLKSQIMGYTYKVQNYDILETLKISYNCPNCNWSTEE